MFKNKFIDFIINKPKQSFLISMVMLILTSVGLKNLKQNFSYRIWFTGQSKYLNRLDQFEKQFGSDDMALVIMESPSGVFDLESAKTIVNITNDLWKAPDIIRVTSLSNFNWTHANRDDIEVEPLIPDDMELTQDLLDKRKEIAVNHKSVKNYLVSEDGKVALFYLKLKPAINGTPDYQKVAFGVREIIQKYRSQSDHKFQISGSALLNQSFKESTEQDLSFLVPLVMLMAVIFLAINLRSFGGVIQSLSIIGSSILLTMGFAGWFGFEINNVTATVPQFMIAIGIADSVHILVTYFVFRRKGLASKDAVRTSLEKNFRPTLLTSLSTCFGFFSFASAGIEPISMMGVMSGAGTILAWLITYLMLGPLMMTLKVKSISQTDTEKALEATERSYHFADLVYKYRFAILVFFFFLGIFNTYYVTKIEVDSNPIAYFDKSFPYRKATDFMEERVGGTMGGEIVIDSGKNEGIKEPDFLHKVDKLQQWIESKPFISKTVSIIDILKDTNQSLNGGDKSFYKLNDNREQIAQQLFLYTMSIPQGMDLNDRMTIRNDALKLTAMWTLHKSSQILKFADDIESKAKELGLNAKVTGKAHLWQTINEPIVNSFIKSLTIAIILISILLIIGLRSVKIGLFAMIPNTLPLLFGGGMITLLGKYLDIGTVIVGSICLGIAVDDTIHFVDNFIKHINNGKSVRESLALIYSHTAPALITTTMVLVASFGTFVFGTFVPNQNFGILVALVLSFALFSDLIFLPALLYVFGEDFFKKE